MNSESSPSDKGTPATEQCSICLARPPYEECPGSDCAVLRFRAETAERDRTQADELVERLKRELVEANKEREALAGAFCSMCERAVVAGGCTIECINCENQRLQESLSAASTTKPRGYCLLNAKGEMHWDEYCIYHTEGEAVNELEALREADPDAGWRVAPFYTSALSSASSNADPAPFNKLLERANAMSPGKTTLEFDASEQHHLRMALHLALAWLRREPSSHATTSDATLATENGYLTVRCPTCKGILSHHRYGDEGLDYLTNQLHVWALIDEVQALRRGVGFTHGNGDPIEALTEKYTGLVSRDFIARTIEQIKSALKNTPIAASATRGRDEA